MAHLTRPAEISGVSAGSFPETAAGNQAYIPPTLDKCPCSKTSMLVFEQGHLSRTIFASVNYLSRKTCHIFHLHYQGKLVKENLQVCTVGKFSLTSGLVKENLPA